VLCREVERSRSPLIGRWGREIQRQPGITVVGQGQGAGWRLRTRSPRRGGKR